MKKRKLEEALGLLKDYFGKNDKYNSVFQDIEREIITIDDDEPQPNVNSSNVNQENETQPIEQTTEIINETAVISIDGEREKTFEIRTEPELFNTKNDENNNEIRILSRKRRRKNRKQKKMNT